MGHFKNFVEATGFPAYEEMTDPDKSPSENCTSDAFTASRTFQCAWADRVVFVNAMLGVAQGTTMIMPARYPACPRAIAISADIKPAGAYAVSGGVVVWDKARITVGYKVPEYETLMNTGREPFITESLEGAAEFLTIPADGLYWTVDWSDPNAPVLADPLQDTEAPGMLRKMWTWVYTMHRLPAVPTAAYQLIGCVNTKPVLSAWFGFRFDVGTLLFSTPTVRATNSAAGTPSWEVALNTTYNKDGWNLLKRKGGKLPQPIYTEVERLVSPGRVEKVIDLLDIYESASFKPLLGEVA